MTRLGICLLLALLMHVGAHRPPLLDIRLRDGGARLQAPRVVIRPLFWSEGWSFGLGERGLYVREYRECIALAPLIQTKCPLLNFLFQHRW